MKIRKIMAAMAALTVSASALCVPAFAKSQPETGSTVSDGKGVLRSSYPIPMSGADLTVFDGKSVVCTGYPVPLSDADGDGAVTINDVLIIHNNEFEIADYAYEETEYGLSMTKLYGIENGGAYGYYVNNVAAMSLLDPVNDGDHVYAFVYSDTVGFSDVYSFFDCDFLYMEDDTAAITLNAASFDENWNPITVPVVGAEITVDGKKSGVFTDENGKAVLTIKNPGVYIVSAVSETQALIPPICSVNRVEKADDAPAGNPVTGISLSIIIPTISALAAFALRKRK